MREMSSSRAADSHFDRSLVLTRQRGHSLLMETKEELIEPIGIFFAIESIPRLNRGLS